MVFLLTCTTGQVGMSQLMKCATGLHEKEHWRAELCSYTDSRLRIMTCDSSDMGRRQDVQSILLHGPLNSCRKRELALASSNLLWLTQVLLSE